MRQKRELIKIKTQVGMQQFTESFPLKSWKDSVWREQTSHSCLFSHFWLNQAALFVSDCFFSISACIKYALSISPYSYPTHTHTHTQRHTRFHTLYACSGGSYNGRMTSLYPVCIWRPVIKTLNLKLSCVVCWWRLFTSYWLYVYDPLTSRVSVIYKGSSSF